MTIRFVQAWNGYRPDQIVTNPNGGNSEATLISLGYAVADLNGPDNSPVPVTGVVNEVTGRISLSAGGQSIGLEPLLYPANGQIKWGSYGDSIANLSSYANFDLRQITTAAGFSVERMGSWIGTLSNGLFRLTANFGVSGEATTAMLARESAGASATRKSIVDAASTGAQFLVNSFGINDIQTLASGASQATIDGVVNTALANIIAILKKQKANGIWPITHSLLGYNLNTATAGEIATRQAASRQLNTAIGSAIIANPELGSLIGHHFIWRMDFRAWRWAWTASRRKRLQDHLCGCG